VMRLPALQRSTGIKFRWRPFHLLVILQEMQHVPFADKPAKSAYMWRDIERRTAMYGVPAALPAPYPRRFPDQNRGSILSRKFCSYCIS
jgi:2-hydroxychromene-2-carboxylate isomerase